MDKPELIIPVRFDYKNAAQDLKKVEQDGQQIGDTTVKRFQGDSTAIKSLGSEIRNLIHPQAGLGAVNQVAGAISDQFQQTLDHIKGVSQEFTELHRTLHQVVALQGQDNTSELPIADVQKATAPALSPEEWRRAQEEFPSRADSHLGGTQARLSQEQLQSYQQQIAEFAKARGIAPAEAMAMGGSLLQFSDGPQDVNQLLDRYGKVFRTLESAPSPVSQLLPQLNRVMSQGFSAEEAAQALAIMSEAMRGEEGSGIENTLKALTNMRLQGKGPELGIQEGMTPFQQIEAAARTLRQRKSNGEDLYQPMKDYAPDLSERRGFLGFMDRGVGAGGFERLRGYVRDTPSDFVEQSIRKYRESAAGWSVQERAELARGKSDQTYQFRTVEQLRHEAEQQLIEGERLTAPDWNPRARELMPSVADSLGQAVNFRALSEVRGRPTENRKVGGDDASLGTVAMTARLQELLERIAHSNERMARQAEDRPLAAPPPNPPGRM